MLHMISAWCVARDLRTVAPGSLERTCWRQLVAQWGDCKNSWIVPLNAIIIIIIILFLFVSKRHSWIQVVRVLSWPIVVPEHGERKAGLGTRYAWHCIISMSGSLWLCLMLGLKTKWCSCGVSSTEWKLLNLSVKTGSQGINDSWYLNVFDCRDDESDVLTLIG